MVVRMASSSDATRTEKGDGPGPGSKQNACLRNQEFGLNTQCTDPRPTVTYGN